jgi:hypothetical protein
VKTQEERSCAVNFQALTKVHQRLTKDAKSFHTVWIGFAARPGGFASLGRTCCETLLPFPFKMATEYRNDVSA